jgi:hypothetical protein
VFASEFGLRVWGKDVVGGFGPHERVAPLVPAVNEGADGGGEFFDAVEGSNVRKSMRGSSFAVTAREKSHTSTARLHTRVTDPD